MYFKGRDIEGGKSLTTCPILYESHAIPDWIIHISRFFWLKILEFYSRSIKWRRLTVGV